VWSAGITAFVLVAAGICGWLLLRHLNQNIRTADGGTSSTTVDGVQDILLVGSDDRSGSDARYGTAVGARSDTTILFHTPADRSAATAVSIPRDSMVQIPDCAKSDGTVAAANFGMFNSAFDEGGIACTVKTVESLTGIKITHFVVLDFTGFAATVDALGGVKVCTTAQISDKDSGLDIPAGVHTLTGEQALAFVRVRHIGDGSDLSRIGRQQYFLHEFSGQIRAGGLLADPLKLYRVLDDATKSIVTDPGLGSLSSLYSLSQTLNQIPGDGVSYLTVPVAPYPADDNRVIWQQPDAANLWSSLLTGPARGSSGSASASVLPGASAGTSAGTSPETSGAAETATTRPTATTGGSGAGSAASDTDPLGLFTCPVS
jgi:LCP family protein required for cell wall assembly